jgi:hypothetical protein
MEDNGDAARGRLPRSFAASQSAADYGDAATPRVNFHRPAPNIQETPNLQLPIAISIVTLQRWELGVDWKSGVVELGVDPRQAIVSSSDRTYEHSSLLQMSCRPFFLVIFSTRKGALHSGQASAIGRFHSVKSQSG